jgi:hypothetical protein
MLKNKSLQKKLNKLLLSVNTRIESFFNNLKLFINLKKKKGLNLSHVDKKILLSVGSVVILVISYFLIPSFYDKKLVKIKLESHILKKYNLEVKLDGDMTYGFLPKPHFFIRDTTINYLGQNLAKTDFTKIYISVDNFFSIDNIKIKNLFFKRTEFNINYKNYNFFKQTLNSINDKDEVNFKNNRLFYNNKNEDVIFLAKMKNLNFFKNSDFNQELNANFEIFNIPLKAKIINNQFENNLFIDLDSNKLRVNIQNDIDYSGIDKIGMMDLSFFNKLKKINYIIKKNSLKFEINKKDIFKGKIDFKPFYLSTDLRLKQINFLQIFDSNSILLNLLNTGILNNQSLNAVVNVHIDKIKHTNYLNNIVLKTYFEEGNIILKDSFLSWKDSIFINLDNVQINVENNKLIFSGVASFNFNDINEFYQQYQVKKIHRKEIKKIKIDFLFNLFENQIQIDNVKIDGVTNKNLNNFLNDFNSEKLDIFNKVLFKNSVKKFFSNF